MYKDLRIREDIYEVLKKLAKLRGVTLQELLLELLAEVSDDEFMEAGVFYDFGK